jgi:dihydrofolate reductase
MNRTEGRLAVGRIVVTEFVSLDGVMQAPGGDDGFVRGAWTFAFDRGDAGNKFKTDETMDADALLLGRRTYEGFAAAWPERDGEFADRFNSMPKYVVSSTLTDPGWTNSTVISMGDVAGLRDRHDGDVYVHGSGTLARALVEQGLVDQLNLMVHPVVLGTGKRLFGDLEESRRFTLTDLRAVGPDGVSIQIYEPAR